MTLPAPLVPLDVDLTDFAFMPLDVRRLRDSRFTATVDGDTFKVGLLLWCASWHQVPAASLPDDDIELAQLAGFGRVVREWRKARVSALYGWVVCSDGRLYHPIVAEKALESWESKLRHAHGKMGDRIRKLNKVRAESQLPAVGIPAFDVWNSGGRRDPVPPETPPPSGGIPAENALKGTEGTGTGKGRELEKKPQPSAVGRASRLPPDFALPKAWGEWALAEFPQWSAEKVRTEAAKFADHWHAATGKGSTKRDWLATWRNWCRSDIAHRDDAKPGAATFRERETAAKRREGDVWTGSAGKPDNVIDMEPGNAPRLATR